jgi:flagellar hook-associated protein 1 FlgK
MMGGMEMVGTSKDIAAAAKLPVEAGDNGNLVNISKITSESIFGGKQSVVTELGSMFVNIGNHTVASKNAHQTADSLRLTSQANWSSFSGVNIQEEELNLIQYQQVYQTVSKVINAAKENFDSLLNII